MMSMPYSAYMRYSCGRRFCVLGCFLSVFSSIYKSKLFLERFNLIDALGLRELLDSSRPIKDCIKGLKKFQNSESCMCRNWINLYGLSTIGSFTSLSTATPAAIRSICSVATFAFYGRALNAITLRIKSSIAVFGSETLRNVAESEMTSSEVSWAVQSSGIL